MPFLLLGGPLSLLVWPDSIRNMPEGWVGGYRLGWVGPGLLYYCSSGWVALKIVGGSVGHPLLIRIRTTRGDRPLPSYGSPTILWAPRVGLDIRTILFDANQ